MFKTQPEDDGEKGSRLKSQFLVFLQFLEDGETAELRLQLSILPHDEQVIRGAGDQTLLLKTQKHLEHKPQ